MYIPLSILTIKIKNITCRFPVNVPSTEENETSQGFKIFRNVCIASFDYLIAEIAAFTFI